MILWWIENEEHLFKTEIFYNIMNVFTVTFDQFNIFLQNKSIHFFKKTNFYRPQTFER